MRRIRGLKDPLLFGKYNGMNVKEIYKIDPSYVAWLYRNQVIMYTSPTSQERFREMATRRTVKWPMGLGKTFDPDFEPDALNALIASVCKRKDVVSTPNTSESFMEVRYMAQQMGKVARQRLDACISDCEMAQEFDLRAEYCGDR